jgi:threonine synthase
VDYCSTRSSDKLDLAGAIMRGLAPDGGLFMPESLPHTAPGSFDGCHSLAEVGTRLLAPLFAGSKLESALADICQDAFSFPIPVVSVPSADGERLAVMELFHGPTSAFKDVGARFLAATMTRILDSEAADPRGPLTILVATSGDTGGAVAAAFHNRPGIRVVVLFPDGQVSPRQQHQLTCWGGNVISLAVKGAFDDCQALVKNAFRDPHMNQSHRLTSANSINIGRLMPQCVYYAAASLEVWRRTGERVNFVVPTGNLGNGFAAIWARAMGLPINDIVLATNMNRSIADYLVSGDWRPRDSIATLASAMDVGDPSNMERLKALHPEFSELRAAIDAYPVDDDEIRQQIDKDFKQRGQTWCPHTATGFWAFDHLASERRRAGPWIVAATAHPAKFETIVEPIIGQAVPVPPALAALMALPARFHRIDPVLQELEQALN